MFKIHLKRCIKLKPPHSISHSIFIEHNYYSAGLIKGDKQTNKDKNQESWILAAPAHNRCTSLVCSCYVASRNSDSKEEESTRPVTTTNVEYRKRPFNVGGFMEYSSKGIVRNISSNSNEVEVEVEVDVEVEGASAPLKSNLKKSASTVEMSPGGMMIRKVSWSDAHGKDIAHVQEFEPSEEGELAGVGNSSCRCAIQ